MWDKIIDGNFIQANSPRPRSIGNTSDPDVDELKTREAR
jgi:hypothetical protein